MKARAKWVEGMAFMGEAGSGHAVMMDGAPDYGGRNIGIRPMEMLLIGLAGCTGFDVVSILKKGREAVTGCEVEVEAERAASDPKVFTRIHLRYRITGKGLAYAKAERAVTLSKEKYCSASIMLGATAAMSYELDVIDELQKDEAA
ncbi:OsmC family protein [Bosea sp. SSUT16]|jgi:putative redox protein|uniref:OsmC family protein n=1 Tax=Bosea spartocytisi TaxID=2773451 RepID=A0A927I3B1_9HYPH|nr:OsmC family protein [Bosea spartocytisi]MBD3848788.1 OsmC family protein [Bosea spartocytisi]MCT4471368.1 OsmC family protein [Bosea spartocytisi]